MAARRLRTRILRPLQRAALASLTTLTVAVLERRIRKALRKRGA